MFDEKPSWQEEVVGFILASIIASALTFVIMAPIVGLIGLFK